MRDAYTQTHIGHCIHQEQTHTKVGKIKCAADVVAARAVNKRNYALEVHRTLAQHVRTHTTHTYTLHTDTC